ncbi:protein NLRC3-like [Genypterus blacodes]|uniref:protein NLRC3-like n=1 Tax=Genypterus blacodes TaxID=154954 RepID=UPI003F757834
MASVYNFSNRIQKEKDRAMFLATTDRHSAIGQHPEHAKLAEADKMSDCQEAEENSANCLEINYLENRSEHSMGYPPVFKIQPESEQTRHRKWSGDTEAEQYCRRCISSDWDYSGPSGDSCYPWCRERIKISLTNLDKFLKDDAELQEMSDQHKSNLRRRCEFAMEETAATGCGTLLDSSYTELHLIEAHTDEDNTQHEVWQLERASRMEHLHDIPIQYQDIFKVLPEQQRPIRVVLTNGIAGIGKTFLVQKFTLDWIEGLQSQDVSLVIQLSFRELNLIKDEQHSLLTLLCVFHPALQTLTAEKLAVCKVLFILDGLDESRLTLDFRGDKVVSDVTKKTSVNILLTNLIKGNLLHSGLVWITSRPAAGNQIPPTCVDRVTELRGFTDPQKDEYFRNRSNNKEICRRIISRLKESRSLHIMCQIPVFCWITAKVLEHILTTDEHQALPKTLTELYSHFLLLQTKRKKLKYAEKHKVSQLGLTENDTEVLLKLGRLAFEYLKNGNLIFYQEDLEQYGLEITDAVVNSGVCTEILKTDSVLFQRSVYCFVHLSIQEFLAAVYIFHCHTNSNNEVLEMFLGKDWGEFRICDPPLDVFLRRATDKSLRSENGHLDLFVRFLHGLSLESNQRLLGSLLGPARNSAESIQSAIHNLKEMSTYNISPDRSINILHCLMEVNELSVHREVQEFLKSENKSKTQLSEIHCSALVYMLQMSEEVLDVLDMTIYRTSEEGRLRLIPAVRNCKGARLSGCRLSKQHCEILASALKTNPSHLRQLDLSDNQLQCSGVKLLCAGLESPKCRLETLRLTDCSLSEACWDYLSSALKSSFSPLRELDLSNNKLQDSGVKLLAAALESPNCKLDTLSLRYCSLSETSCRYMASALKSSSCHLRELDLSYNKLHDSGVKLLCAGLKSPNCELDTLRLSFCSLSETSCAYLAAALKFNPFHLGELDLRGNELRDSGAKLLPDQLQKAKCRLQRLRLGGGGSIL